MTIKVNIEHVVVGGDTDKQLFMQVGGTVWRLEAGQGCSPLVTKDQDIWLFYDRRKASRRSSNGTALPYWTEQSAQLSR